MKNIMMAQNDEGYIIRSFTVDDIDDYYHSSYCPLSPDVIKYTGCKENFSKEEVSHHVKTIIDATDRYDFLIIAPNGQPIGETVINEIDFKNKSANFRIALFNNQHMNKGIGSWATQETVHFAFNEIKLHRLELDVFSINKRAQKVYEKAGFKVEGVRREALLIDGQYVDDILMSILVDEWKERINL